MPAGVPPSNQPDPPVGRHQTASDTLVMAGASGFVGTHLRNRLNRFHRVIALTRATTLREEDNDGNTMEWRSCDLFSLPQLESTMSGAVQAIYLIHSMVPGTRLSQGSFADYDLLLADNFVRAAEAAGLRHILYLGGLIPEGDSASPHLASRKEVENVLRSRSLPVTVLRSGLIFGPCGSSATMLLNLVRRLPVMILPKWAGTRTRTADIRHIVEAVAHVLKTPQLWGGTYDICSHPSITYGELIDSTARVLHKRPILLRIPGQFLGLSKRWVSLFGSVPISLADPLIDSLRYELESRTNALQEILDREPLTLEDSIRSCLGPDDLPLRTPRQRSRKTVRQTIIRESRVRSVQRLPLPKDWNAGMVASEYGTWLTKLFRRWIHVQQDGDGRLRFSLSFPSVCLLELTPTPFTTGNLRRKAYYLTGGILVSITNPPGRFEFRIFPEIGCVVAAIHGYRPSLPWWIYQTSQALIHIIVMRAFGRHLHRMIHPSTSGNCSVEA